jgi:hypothetical protein
MSMRRTGLLLAAILVLPLALSAAGCSDEITEDAALDRHKAIQEGNKQFGLTPEDGD